MVAWRIIPRLGYLVNNHGDRTSPLTGVIPLPNGHSWLVNGGYEPLTDWDDPPSGAMADMSGLKVGFDGT